VSPVHGIVLEKPVLEGQRVAPGQLLYRLADLSEVWVLGEVFEQDLQFVHEGSRAHVEVSAYPGQHVMGEVTFVYPTVDPQSRTNHVRVTLANPEGRLKPGMFATLYFDVPMGEVLSVPMEAVVVTGERNLVFVHDSAGMLQPRQVVLGSRAGDWVQILSGLQPGEELVASANFLVDAESRLAGGAGGMPGMPGMQHGASDMQDMDSAEPDSAGEGHRHD
jgi:Cu(I)/Ag(I) efflux system membrane fusion protein